MRQVTVQELLTLDDSYEVWDEEKKDWVDIESSCYSEMIGGFARHTNPVQAITAITLRHNNDTFYVFGTTKFEYLDSDQIVYYKCGDETEMLEKFLSIWQKLDLDIISGWNIEGFDIPYIVARLTFLLGEDFAKKLSPWRMWTRHRLVNFGNEEYVNFPMGIAVLDYLDLYKKFGYSSAENNKLDTVAEYELGEKKIDYSEYAGLDDLLEKNPQLYLAYNVMDVRLVERIDKKMGLIDLALTMAYESKVLYEDTFTTVRLWDTIIHNHMLDKGLVVDPEVYHGQEDYPGGYVKEPIPGLYEWVVSFDVASEYPSIILECNISPETYRGQLDDEYTVDQLLNGELSEANKSFLKENNLALTANGALWDKTKQGILPELVDTIFANRQKYRNMMKDAKKEYEKNKTEENAAQVSTYNNKQMAAKIQLNSLYGALGNKYFRHYKLEAAKGITTTGQLAIRWIEKGLLKYLDKILGSSKDRCIAIDTDSVYLTLKDLIDAVKPPKPLDFVDSVCSKKLEPEITRLFSDLADYLNAFSSSLKMKREKISDRGLWCCHPDTEIFVNNASKTIFQLYNEYQPLDREEQPSISFNRKSNTFDFDIIEDVFRKKYDGDMISFALENGETLKLTAEHICFVYRDGILIEIPACEVRESDDFLSP